MGPVTLDATPNISWFDFHGVNVELHSEVPWAEELWMDRFRSFLSSRALAPSCQIAFYPCKADTARQIEKIKPAFSWERSRTLYGDRVGSFFRLTDGRSLAAVDYQEQDVRFWVDPQTLTDSVFFSRTFLQIPLLELLRLHGFFYMHAALLSHHGRGTLIMGKGGAGKSTLCAALVREGFEIVGDDSILIRNQVADEVWGYPLEPELSLEPARAAEFGFIGSGHTNVKKFRIPRSMYPQIFTKSGIPIEQVAVLRRSSQKMAAPLPRSDLLQVAFEENPMIWTDPELAQIHFDILAKLSRRIEPQVVSIPWESSIDLAALAITWSDFFPGER